MLITIIRNLIVLSNTSINVGPAAISALLETNNQHKDTNSPLSYIEKNQQYLYHLYNPLYSNNHLHQNKLHASNQLSTERSANPNDSCKIIIEK